MDNTIHTAEDVEQFLRLNLLAVVPKQVEEASSAVKEAYLTLRTSLLFSRKGRAANVLLVPAAGPTGREELYRGQCGQDAGIRRGKDGHPRL